MNEKPLHIPLSFHEALQRLAKVPKSEIGEARGKHRKKGRGKLKQSQTPKE